MNPLGLSTAAFVYIGILFCSVMLTLVAIKDWIKKTHERLEKINKSNINPIQADIQEMKEFLYLVRTDLAKTHGFVGFERVLKKIEENTRKP